MAVRFHAKCKLSTVPKPLYISIVGYLEDLSVESSIAESTAATEKSISLDTIISPLNQVYGRNELLFGSAVTRVPLQRHAVRPDVPWQGDTTHRR